MIIVRLIGGLGNQLFQFAAAKSLSVARQVALKIDASVFSGNSSRKLDLEYFTIYDEYASIAETERFTQTGFIQKCIDRLKAPHNRHIYKEPHFHFDKHFFKAGPDVYLKGYWQSPHYFSSIQSLIKDLYTIRQQNTAHLQQQADVLGREESVSIHIRRGDYLDASTLAYHGTLQKEYYNQAISTLAEKISSPKFYFFSDDIDWVKKNIIINHPYEFISGVATRLPIEDFFLMSRCRHNIIANSSFSWWAAWLNNNAGKIVIAPKQWFNKAGHNTNDLIPGSWIRL